LLTQVVLEQTALNINPYLPMLIFLKTDCQKQDWFPKAGLPGHQIPSFHFLTHEQPFFFQTIVIVHLLGGSAFENLLLHILASTG
jgi:hypothetical protein